MVLATNRLGTARLEIRSARGFCTPSWTSTTGPPDHADPAPPGLGQLSCYRIGYVKRGGRFRTPATLAVKDRFSATRVQALIAGPRLLCLSANVGGGGSPSTPTSTAQYVCFAAGPTPTKTPVYDQNEFGAGSVRVGNTEMLCLPSTKKVLVSPRR